MQAGAGFRPAGADAPDLAGRQGIRVDGVVAAQFRRGDELLHPVLAHRVAEVGVAELASEHPLLLFLDPAARFQGEARQWLQFLVRHGHFRVGVKQLEQAAQGFVDRRDVAPAQGAAVMQPPLQGWNAAAAAQSAPALRKKIADQAEVPGEVLVRVELGEIPAGRVGVDAVHERGVVAHVRRQRA